MFIVLSACGISFWNDANYIDALQTKNPEFNWLSMSRYYRQSADSPDSQSLDFIFGTVWVRTQGRRRYKEIGKFTFGYYASSEATLIENYFDHTVCWD